MNKTTKIILVIVMMLPVLASLVLLSYYKKMLSADNKLPKEVVEKNMKKALTITILIAVFFGISFLVMLFGGIIG